MPKPKEKPVDALTERGEPLTWPSVLNEEEEQLRGQYYPNLNPNIAPRDWDEPPWGHGK